MLESRMNYALVFDADVEENYPGVTENQWSRTYSEYECSCHQSPEMVKHLAEQKIVSEDKSHQ